MLVLIGRCFAVIGWLGLVYGAVTWKTGGTHIFVAGLISTSVGSIILSFAHKTK